MTALRACLALVLSASSALGAPCRSADEWRSTLSGRWGEGLIAAHPQDNGSVVENWQTPEVGWKDWQRVTEALAKIGAEQAPAEPYPPEWVAAAYAAERRLLEVEDAASWTLLRVWPSEGVACLMSTSLKNEPKG